MRTISAGILAVALAFAAAPDARQSASIVLDGRVTAGTGADTRPVRRAQVTLLGGGTADRPRLADTDAKGMYRFENVRPGPHRIAVSKPGFVRVTEDAVPGGAVNLVRAGAIEGVVLDASGDPFRSVTVSALQAQAGGKTQPIKTSQTDDLGRYRLHSLPPGDYIIQADAADAVMSQLMMPGEKRGAIPRGFYPATETIESAKPAPAHNG